MTTSSCTTIDCAARFFAETVWHSARSIDDWRAPFEWRLLYDALVHARPRRPGGIWLRRFAWYGEPLELDLDSSYVQMLLRPFTRVERGVLSFSVDGVKSAELRVLGRRYEWEDWVRLRAEVKARAPAKLVVVTAPPSRVETALTHVQGAPCARRVLYMSPKEAEEYESECEYAIYKADDALKYGVLMELGLLRRRGLTALYDAAFHLSRMALEALLGTRYHSLLIDSALISSDALRAARKSPLLTVLSHKTERVNGEAYWQLVGGLIGVKGREWYDTRMWYVNNDGLDARYVARHLRPALRAPRLRGEDWRFTVWARDAYERWLCGGALTLTFPTPTPLGAALTIAQARCAPP